MRRMRRNKADTPEQNTLFIPFPMLVPLILNIGQKLNLLDSPAAFPTAGYEAVVIP